MFLPFLILNDKLCKRLDIELKELTEEKDRQIKKVNQIYKNKLDKLDNLMNSYGHFNRKDMQITEIITLNGKKYSGSIEYFNIDFGYIRLMGINKKFYFENMKSAITKGSRISKNKIGDVDEIERYEKLRKR